MFDHSNPKSMAKALRKGLGERGIAISHADSLELVARQFGFANWNILAARLRTTGGDLRLPSGWTVAGSHQYYHIGRDSEIPGALVLQHLGQPSSDRGDVFSTAMQSIDASDYVGRRVRLRGLLRSESAGRGALWMRVDATGHGKMLSFDNMLHRTVDGFLSGTCDWTNREVVLDVPPGAGSIHYGVLLGGHGKLWARHLSFDEVDAEVVSSTEMRLPKRPTNLNFGETA